MELPVVEKAVLVTSVSEINGGLGLLYYQLDADLKVLEPMIFL